MKDILNLRGRLTPVNAPAAGRAPPGGCNSQNIPVLAQETQVPSEDSGILMTFTEDQKKEQMDSFPSRLLSCFPLGDSSRWTPRPLPLSTPAVVSGRERQSWRQSRGTQPPLQPWCSETLAQAAREDYQKGAKPQHKVSPCYFNTMKTTFASYCNQSTLLALRHSPPILLARGTNTNRQGHSGSVTASGKGLFLGNRGSHFNSLSFLETPCHK